MKEETLDAQVELADAILPFLPTPRSSWFEFVWSATSGELSAVESEQELNRFAVPDTWRTVIVCPAGDAASTILSRIHDRGFVRMSEGEAVLGSSAHTDVVRVAALSSAGRARRGRLITQAGSGRLVVSVIDPELKGRIRLFAWHSSDVDAALDVAFEDDDSFDSALTATIANPGAPGAVLVIADDRN
jgi:hypothetical protein